MKTGQQSPDIAKVEARHQRLEGRVHTFRTSDRADGAAFAAKCSFVGAIRSIFWCSNKGGVSTLYDIYCMMLWISA